MLVNCEDERWRDPGGQAPFEEMLPSKWMNSVDSVPAWTVIGRAAGGGRVAPTDLIHAGRTELGYIWMKPRHAFQWVILSLQLHDDPLGHPTNMKDSDGKL